MDAKGFLPRSESKVVLSFTLACYAFTLGRLILSLANIFTPFHQPRGVFAGSGLLAETAEALILTPVVATAVLVAILEVLRLVRVPTVASIIVAAVASCAINAIVWKPWGLVVAPLFLLSGYGYLRWRRESWFVAFTFTVLIHVFTQLPPSIYSLASSARKTPNQAMQRTAGRSAFPLSVTSTFSLQPPAPSPAVADLGSR